MVIPLFVGRDRSIQALQQSMERDKRILLVAQMDASQDNPSIEEIYRIRDGLHHPAAPEAPPTAR